MDLREILKSLDLDSNLLGPLIFLSPWLFRVLRNLLRRGSEQAIDPDAPDSESEGAASGGSRSTNEQKTTNAAERIVARLSLRREALAVARGKALAQDELDEDFDEQLAELAEETLPENTLPATVTQPVESPPAAATSFWDRKQASLSQRRINSQMIRKAVVLETALRSRSQRGIL